MTGCFKIEVFTYINHSISSKPVNKVYHCCNVIAQRNAQSTACDFEYARPGWVQRIGSWYNYLCVLSLYEYCKLCLKWNPLKNLLHKGFIHDYYLWNKNFLIKIWTNACWLFLWDSWCSLCMKNRIEHT